MIDFNRMRWLIRKIPEEVFEIERKMSNATRITSVITGMPRGGGGNQQENRIIDLIAVKDAYREAIAELEAMRAELEPLVDQLNDPNERAIMRLRYFGGYSPDQITGIVNKARSNVYACLNRAERRILGGQNK